MKTIIKNVILASALVSLGVQSAPPTIKRYVGTKIVDSFGTEVKGDLSITVNGRIVNIIPDAVKGYTTPNGLLFYKSSDCTGKPYLQKGYNENANSVILKQNGEYNLYVDDWAYNGVSFTGYGSAGGDGSCMQVGFMSTTKYRPLKKIGAVNQMFQYVLPFKNVLLVTPFTGY